MKGMRALRVGLMLATMAASAPSTASAEVGTYVVSACRAGGAPAPASSWTVVPTWVSMNPGRSPRRASSTTALAGGTFGIDFAEATTRTRCSGVVVEIRRPARHDPCSGVAHLAPRPRRRACERRPHIASSQGRPESDLERRAASGRESWEVGSPSIADGPRSSRSTTSTNLPSAIEVFVQRRLGCARAIRDVRACGSCRSHASRHSTLPTVDGTPERQSRAGRSRGWHRRSADRLPRSRRRGGAAWLKVDGEEQPAVDAPGCRLPAAVCRSCALSHRTAASR